MLLATAIIIDVCISTKLSNLSDARLFSSWNYIFSDNTYHDVIINGNSRALCQYNPRIIDSILFVNSYNLGADAARINRQIIKYKFYTKNHGTPKYYIQNIDYLTIEDIHGIEIEQFYPYFFYEREFISEIDKYENFTIFEKYCPSFRYLGALRFFNIEKDCIYKGFLGRGDEYDSSILNSIDAANIEADIDMINEFILFLNQLKSDSVKVLFVYAPSYHKVKEKFINYNEMFVMYESIAKQYNIPILDYTCDSMCYDSIYFYNATHLNKAGAELFTTKLAHDIDSIGFIVTE